MVNLFDIVHQAQRGSGLDGLARQFGLGPVQVQSAVEALLPAFSLALQRSAMNPGAFADILGAIGSGRYAPFFDPAGSWSARPQGPGGEDLVARLFRTPEATRDVAAQAAAMTGIGVQVVQHMMPHLAAMLIGGLSRYASMEGMSDVLRQWSDALKTASRETGRPSAAPAGDPWAAWTEAARTMMGAPKPAPAPPDPFEAWTAAMATLMGAPAPAPPPPAPATPNPFEALSQMFETGREVQQQHLASFQTILDGVWGPGRARQA